MLAAVCEASIIYNRTIIYRLYSNATGTLNNLEKGYSQSGLRFVWNIDVDFRYQINPGVALDLGYKFSDFGKVDFGI